MTGGRQVVTRVEAIVAMSWIDFMSMMSYKTLEDMIARPESGKLIWSFGRSTSRSRYSQ